MKAGAAKSPADVDGKQASAIDTQPAVNLRLGTINSMNTYQHRPHISRRDLEPPKGRSEVVISSVLKPLLFSSERP